MRTHRKCGPPRCPGSLLPRSCAVRVADLSYLGSSPQSKTGVHHKSHRQCKLSDPAGIMGPKASGIHKHPHQTECSSAQELRSQELAESHS